MSKALKSILPIGGAIAGGFLGGPGGALLGGALGGSLGGTGDVGDVPSIPGMASNAGFSAGPINTQAFSLTGGTLSRNDLSMAAQQRGIIDGLVGANAGISGLSSSLMGIKPNFAGTANSLEELRGQVRPGFGRLTEARVQAIRNAGAESIGNLRESLSRRGVMGSSFANDAETRTRMATGQEEERARAEAFTQEIGMSRQIITDQITNELTRFGAALGLAQEDRALMGQYAANIAQRATLHAQQMDRELNELGVVGNIRNGVNAAVSQQAMQMAQLQMFQQQANAQNQSGFAGLGTAGIMGMFGKGGVFG